VLSLNRKTDYALVALAHVASEGDEGTPISARAVANSYGLPRALLAKLMKELHRAGLLESIRGAGGGYRLARAAEAITLSQVIAAIEGPVQVALCCREEAEDEGHTDGEESEECLMCRIERLCPIGDAIETLNSGLVSIFETLTLRHLLENRVAEAMREAVDFHGPPTKQAETRASLAERSARRP